jgi:hypothetical protein
MATKIIQSPRRIQSPGVQITEIDLTRRPAGLAPRRPAAMVAGFAPQGPTDEIVRITSMAQFNTVFGLPETAAERYLSHTVEQLASTGSDVLVTRLPYGKNAGEGIQNYYSALFFPIIPHGKTYGEAETYYVLPPKSVLLSEDAYENQIKDRNIAWTNGFQVSSVANKTFSLTWDQASAIFLDIVNDLSVTDVSFVNSYFGPSETVYTGPVVLPTQLNLSRPLTSFNLQRLFEQRINDKIDSLAYESNNETNQLKKEAFGVPTAWASVTTNLSLTSYAEQLSAKSSTRNNFNIPINYTLNYLTDYADNVDKFTINSIDDINKAGIIIVNSDKVRNNDLFEGFYIGLTDNSDDTPYTDFNAVTSLQAVNSISAIDGMPLSDSNKAIQTFFTVPEERLNFTLSEPYSSINFQSVSERMARWPSYDFSQDSFNDCLKLFVFRINTSTNLQDAITLNTPSTVEAYVGSLYSQRKQNNPNGGRLVNFFIENKVENNSNSRIRMVVNPNISESGTWTDSFAMPTKRVIISDAAKSLWATGIYTPSTVTSQNKRIGNLMLKLDRTFQMYELTENETKNLDIVCEAGLGTIHAGVKYQENITGNIDQETFDDTIPVDISNLKIIPKNYREYLQTPDIVRDSYVDIVRRFRTVAQQRKNHVFISDPLRYIFVKGINSKTSDRKAFNFVDDIFRPLQNSYARIGRSTYMSVYANWMRRYDASSDEFAWVPPSGFVGRIMLNAKKRAPWTAPAGFNYGRLSGVADLAVNPNQRQRDILYRSAYNPVVNFPREGMVVYGQKTFINYQTAFDRLNVRNLFLHLEKESTRILDRFVFEPNTIPTRNRVILRLTPLFERAKTRQGIYDYRLICDERNNTPDVIDRNELRLAVYIQPVRTAEFILADFIATRTGVDLDDLIG